MPVVVYNDRQFSRQWITLNFCLGNRNYPSECSSYNFGQSNLRDFRGNVSIAVGVFHTNQKLSVHLFLNPNQPMKPHFRPILFPAASIKYSYNYRIKLKKILPLSTHFYFRAVRCIPFALIRRIADSTYETRYSSRKYS